MGQAAAWVVPVGYVEPDVSAESPTVERRFRHLVKASVMIEQLVHIAPRFAATTELLRFHTAGYVERIETLSEAGGGDADETTAFGAGSYRIACLAVGGCIPAVDAVLDGSVRNSHALVRPPGHHAEADRGRGACILANIALAAMHARARGGERIGDQELQPA